MSVSNTDDVIDSRDVISRLEELENEKENLIDDELTEWQLDNEEEYNSLKSFATENENVDDWEYGAFFIRDSYFAEYMQEWVEEVGNLPKNLPSYIKIDWEATARNLRSDYTSVDFDGETYWVR